MELQYAHRMNNLKSSTIRELLKLTEQPDIISFAGGLPAPDLFPVEKFSQVALDCMRTEGRQALQYAPTEGYLPLREKITERMAKVHVKADPDHILITNGSQQGLDFSGKLFVNPGDLIALERPSYLGAINAFKAYEPQFLEIEMDHHGLMVEHLEKELQTKTIRFLYTIPDFQNPTGRTMSLERRHKLIELANKYNFVIIEDNPYGELRFENTILPSLASLDTQGRVVFLGTFSKTFCPGLRLGWVYAHPQVLQKYNTIKQGSDLQASTLCQRQANYFLNIYPLDEHIQFIISTYKRKRNIMFEVMDAEFPKSIHYTRSEGGLFTWGNLPEGARAQEVLQLALKEKVAFVPGDSFYANGGDDNHFRLNYSNMSEKNIEIGMSRLAKVLHAL